MVRLKEMKEEKLKEKRKLKKYIWKVRKVVGLLSNEAPTK